MTDTLPTQCPRCANAFVPPAGPNWCMYCLDAAILRTVGPAVQHFFALLPRADLAAWRQAAEIWAQANSLLATPARTTGQETGTPPLEAQVRDARAGWRLHLDFLNSASHAPPMAACAELLLCARHLTWHYRTVLAQEGAPQDWTQLERRLPGAALQWCLWFEVWCAGALALARPWANSPTAATQDMRGVLEFAPPELIGLRTNLRHDNGAILLAGWAASQTRLHPEVKAVLAREGEPYTVLHTRLPGDVLAAWGEGPSSTKTFLKRIQGAVGGTREHQLKHSEGRSQATLRKTLEDWNTPPDPCARIERQDLYAKSMARARLTAYEKAILDLKSQGYPDQDIATTLDRPLTGVKQALRAIKVKLAKG